MTKKVYPFKIFFFEKDSSKMRESQFLSLVTIVPNEAQLLIDMTQLTGRHSCLVNHCQISQQGQQYLLSMVLSGTWSAIAKVESSLNALSKKNKILMILQRLSTPPPPKQMLPYNLYFVTQANPKVLHQILNYLKSDDLLVLDVSVDCFKTRVTQVQMQSITVRILLNSTTILGEWREQFTLFCDEMNIDAIMEPEKW